MPLLSSADLHRWMRSVGGTAFRSLPRPLRYHIRGRWQVPPTDEYVSSRQRQRIHQELNQRLQAGPGPSMWFLSWTTWFSHVFQRWQQMARALAEIGCPVIYYEPWQFEAHLTSQEGISERRFVGVRDLAPRLHLLRCPKDLLPAYLVEHQPDALVMILPGDFSQAKLIPPDTSSFVVYEMIDAYDLIPHADEVWHRTHREWIHKADVLAATADALLAQLAPERPDTLLLPNGVRVEDWRAATPPRVPEDMAAARRAPVLVGYHGALSHWFDWEMWEQAARARPNWAFVLVGLPYLVTYESILARVRQHPNMYYLGPKPYDSLVSYTAHFDIATIPFVLNRITHACSPVKLFEYMAADKPIVATPMQEVLKYKSVLVADSPEAFVAQLDRALLSKADPAYRAILRQEAQANTWQARARVLRLALESARHQQDHIPRRQKGMQLLPHAIAWSDGVSHSAK